MSTKLEENRIPRIQFLEYIAENIPNWNTKCDGFTLAAFGQIWAKNPNLVDNCLIFVLAGGQTWGRADAGAGEAQGHHGGARANLCWNVRILKWNQLKCPDTKGESDQRYDSMYSMFCLLSVNIVYCCKLKPYLSQQTSPKKLIFMKCHVHHWK